MSCVVLGTALVGCDRSTEQAGSDDPTLKDAVSTSSMKGQIEIDGSSTVAPISNAMQEQFHEGFPEIVINVSGKGTGNGFQRFSDSEIDISGASRPIKASERETCLAAGVEFIELPIAYDGLTFVLNKENDWVKQLTVEQLKQIFASDAPVKKWNEIDSSWPDQEINIFAPGTGSGTYDYTREVLAKKSTLREDMNLNEDDNVLVKGVAGNKYSIGFFGVAYYEENKDKLIAVPIVNPNDNQAYLPTTENIASGLYAPFSRPLFIYVNSKSVDKAEVQTFVQFYLDNVASTCERVGYVRLPDELLAKSSENFLNVVTGTHFVNEDGEKREGALAEVFSEANLLK